MQYPIFWIESKKRRTRTSYDVVSGMRGFTTITRLPEIGRFSSGKVFTSDGTVFAYDGESGWPRFTGVVKNLCEALIIPSLVSKFFEGFTYFGPKTVSSQKLDVGSFRKEILRCMSVFEKKDFAQLDTLLSSKTDYQEIIEAIDWFRYHGGKRDEDGHLL